MSLWSEMLGAKVDFVTVNSFNTRYIVAGHGEPLVLVHGTGGHLENFSKIFAQLKNHYRVYALDLVGFGLSEKPEASYDVPLWGNHLDAFIKQVVGKPAFVVGHSLGGWICAYTALKSPQYFRRLIFLTSIGFELVGEEGQVLSHFYKYHRENSVVISKDFVKKRLHMLVNDRESIPEEWVDVRHAIYNDPETKNVMLRWADYIPGLLDQGSQVQPYLLTKSNIKKMAIPVLFLIADQDPFTPPHVVTRVQEDCSNTSLHVVKNASHWPHVEKPDEVVQVIKGFLNNK